MLAKIITMVELEWGATVAFATDVARLPEEMAMVGPTMVVAVPRIFEKVFNAAQQKAHSEGHGAIFDKAAEVAIAWSHEHGLGGLHPIVHAEHAVFDRLVYRKVHEVFGNRLRFAFSGGGPLGERLTHFFNGVGVQVFEGYGLTETSPTLTVNRSGAWKPGTVGLPVAATTIKIAPTARSWPRAHRSSLATGTTTAPTPRPSTRRAGSRRATSGLWTTRATCTSPAARAALRYFARATHVFLGHQPTKSA